MEQISRLKTPELGKITTEEIAVYRRTYTKLERAAYAKVIETCKKKIFVQTTLSRHDKVMAKDEHNRPNLYDTIEDVHYKISAKAGVSVDELEDKPIPRISMREFYIAYSNFRGKDHEEVMPTCSQKLREWRPASEKVIEKNLNVMKDLYKRYYAELEKNKEVLENA